MVEDDIFSAQQLSKVLKKESYQCDTAMGFSEAEQFLDVHTYALILLDWNLGDGDGLVLLQQLRQDGVETPVLMLSANSEIDDRVKVLDAGADDYLCKPYSHIELLARIRALLRRESVQKVSTLSVGDVVLEMTTHEVSVGGGVVALTVSEFDLLLLFMQNPNLVLTRYQLNEYINKDSFAVKQSNIVDVHVKNLRKKLERPELIKSVRGVGYKLGIGDL